MRIALVIGNYDARGGGAERWTDRHARMLLEHGHEVHLVSRGFREPAKGAVCHLVDTRKGKLRYERLRFGECAEAIVRNEKFGVTCDMGDGWYADVFMPHHGSRRAGFERNTELLAPAYRDFRQLASKWLPRYRAFRLLEERQYDSSSEKIFVALSSMVRDHMQQYHDLAAERIRVVYNGVDTEHFTPPSSEEPGKSVRRALGFSNELVYLMIAHNFELKGLGAALTSFSTLARAEMPVGFLVVGPGKTKKYLRLAKKLGCEDLVRFVGASSDPLPYYHAADVYVQPTHYDPCSLVVLEALACGLPVITSRYNGASELIDSKQEGHILKDPEDTTVLMGHMAYYFDEDRLKKASIAARRLAEQHSIQRNYDELFDIYREVADRKVTG